MKKMFFIMIILYVGILSMNSICEEAMANENTMTKQSETTPAMPDMTTYYICQIIRGPNWTAELSPEHERLQAIHLAFIQSLLRKGKIIAGGPITDGDDVRGMVVFRVNSLNEAKALFASDPKVQAGHLTATWNTWLVPKDLLPEQTYLNKTKTGRALHFDATLDMCVSEVFLLWSTSEGAKKFFAADARIDPVFGGRYEIIFDPESDPEGKSAGSFGARILQYEKDKALAFEWTMPPFTAELNTKPLPTWVEVRFEPVAGHSSKTRISLEHFGFGRGENWDRAYEFFQDSSWPLVMNSLRQYCNEKTDP